MAPRARGASPAAKATAARAAKRSAPKANLDPADRLAAVEARCEELATQLQNIAKFLAMGVAQNALQQQMSAQLQTIAPQ